MRVVSSLLELCFLCKVNRGAISPLRRCDPSALAFMLSVRVCVKVTLLQWTSLVIRVPSFQMFRDSVRSLRGFVRTPMENK